MILSGSIYAPIYRTCVMFTSIREVVAGQVISNCVGSFVCIFVGSFVCKFTTGKFSGGHPTKGFSGEGEKRRYGTAEYKYILAYRVFIYCSRSVAGGLHAWAATTLPDLEVQDTKQDYLVPLAPNSFACEAGPPPGGGGYQRILPIPPRICSLSVFLFPALISSALWRRYPVSMATSFPSRCAPKGPEDRSRPSRNGQRTRAQI